MRTMKDQQRVIELALRDYRGTLDECLADPQLTAEERKAFEHDSRIVAELLSADGLNRFRIK